MQLHKIDVTHDKNNSKLPFSVLLGVSFIPSVASSFNCRSFYYTIRCIKCMTCQGSRKVSKVDLTVFESFHHGLVPWHASFPRLFFFWKSDFRQCYMFLFTAQEYLIGCEEPKFRNFSRHFETIFLHIVEYSLDVHFELGNTCFMLAAMNLFVRSYIT